MDHQNDLQTLLFVVV